MRIPIISPRTELPSDYLKMFDRSCKAGISWYTWCPVDVVLLVLVLGVILVACCMVYQKNRTSSGPESTRSNRTRYYRLSLPYPSDRNESPSLEKGGYGREDEANSTFMDPYHRVTKFDDSLIAKDPLFLHPSVPKPILVKKTPKELSGLGLGIQMEQQSPVSGSFDDIPSLRLVRSPSPTSARPL